jgi:hypothetical protein
MGINDELRHYGAGAFTDHDLSRCSGLSGRAHRELVKVRAIQTITEGSGPGRVRLYGTTTFKRMAGIAALNQAGFSLEMSGRITYLLPLEQMLYTVYDPRTILLDVAPQIDPQTGLSLRLKTPLTDWFDPDKPVIADPKNDWLIEIYDGRFVALTHSALAEPMIYGDLRDAGTRFVHWYPFLAQQRSFPGAIKQLERVVYPNKIGAYIAKRDSSPDRIDPNFLKYQYEKHDTDDDPLCIVAYATARSPLFKTSINLTLAIRKALRKYLGIDPVIPDSEIGESR